MTADHQRATKNKRSKRNTKKIKNGQTAEREGPAQPSDKTPKSPRRKTRSKRRRRRAKRSPDRRAKSVVAVETEKSLLRAQESRKFESHSLSRARRSMKRKEQGSSL